jgi:hypothetical protein
MSKSKKHILSLDNDYEYEMIGICSHHNDYRLVWGINDVLSLHLSKAHEDFIVVNKKGTYLSQHSLYEYKDEDNLLEYYLIKNKHFGKFLIHEKPSIDYFLFIYGIDYEDLDGISQKLKQLSSVLAIFPLDPMEIESTENLIFR